MDTQDNKPPILNILVVGFHHKLGCQVEFSYPPLITGTSGKNECPSGWKYLPTLALPDGSHNFAEDTVFFNLPSLMDPTESIYGVSCYRQIPVEKLKIRTADVTRSTVQKSVCILARLPIYGYIEVKLSLIADAFFDQGDFSCTELLSTAYEQLNACLLNDESRRSLRHFHVGLSLREIVLHWRHKTLILFKLFLLQRRVVCFGSPVRSMCALILGIASLMPRLLEKGFQEVACVRTSRPLSPMPDFTDCIQRESEAIKAEVIIESEAQSKVEVERPELKVETLTAQQEATNAQQISVDTAEVLEATPLKISPVIDAGSCGDVGDDYTLVSSAASANESASSGDASPPLASDSNGCVAAVAVSPSLQRLDSAECELGDIGGKLNERSNSLTRESSVDTIASTLLALSTINPDEYRAPISIFASGNLCLPYLSLPYMDLLSDPSVLSYVIGTSNVLFQQKRQLSDVLVDIENANIEAYEQELRRQLVLSTEDLRFIDYLLKHVQAPKEDGEGSEPWMRAQFQCYMLALLRTAVATDLPLQPPKDCEHFNAHFVCAFKKTQCFQEWNDVRPCMDFFDALPAGHPFAGTLSVSDVKLKIAQTMQSTESGRKINQAVNTTSRAVGGAISQAKGAFSHWWSAMTTTPATGGNLETSTSALPQTAQAIAVTFQNSSTDADNEQGVSIHIEESAAVLEEANIQQLDELAAQSSVESELNKKQETAADKLIDSAEELDEDALVVVDTLTSATTSNTGGIIEIAHEAALLDKQQQQQQQQQSTAVLPQSCAAGIVNTSNNTTPPLAANTAGNGDVFIV